jgi:hypothetical protein
MTNVMTLLPAGLGEICCHCYHDIIVRLLAVQAVFRTLISSNMGIRVLVEEAAPVGSFRCVNNHKRFEVPITLAR